ncbi:MAG: hypothetical protein K9I71_11010 [Ignavibacteriales bacterium]|nr:hypothetical protein [Ignavibacteriales bacterium]
MPCCKRSMPPASGEGDESLADGNGQPVISEPKRPDNKTAPENINSQGLYLF